jgi:uncharacterized integral membrane protein
MNPEITPNNQVERNEEFFTVRKELFKGQIKFGIVAVIIFVIFLLLGILFNKDLTFQYIAYVFYPYLIIGAILWEKKFKQDILNKYNPKYKNVTNWR